MTSCLSDEAFFEKQLEDREAIKLKYSRLRRAIRAKWKVKCTSELDELRKEEVQETRSLPRLKIPESYLNG